MAYHAERTTETIENNSDDRIVSNKAEGDGLVSLAVNIVMYVAGVIILLLTFRFVLALLGANGSNGFASFINDLSHPFVSPFFTLFNYKTQLIDGSRFEIYTLVAMAVYATIAFGITRLLTINQSDNS